MNENFNEVFSERLKFFMGLKRMNQADLAKAMDVSEATVSNWTRAVKVPRADKIDKLCDIFHCKRSDLLENPTDESMGSMEIEHIKNYSQLQPEWRSLIDDLIAALQEQPPDSDKILSIIGKIASVLRS